MQVGESVDHLVTEELWQSCISEVEYKVFDTYKVLHSSFSDSTWLFFIRIFRKTKQQL